MSYFPNRPADRDIKPGEIASTFFKELFKSPVIPDSIEAAHLLVSQVFDPIAEEAHVFNQAALHQPANKVKRLRMLGISNMLRVTSIQGISYIVTSEEYFYFSQDGAILIHRSKAGYDGNHNVARYRNNDFGGLILSRPGATLCDVWGNPMLNPVEFFSSHASRRLQGA